MKTGHGYKAEELWAFADKNTSKGDRYNRHLLKWLSDDASRAALFNDVNHHCGGELGFPSRDASPRECDSDCDGVDAPRKPAVPGHVRVTMVTQRDTIQQILTNTRKGKHYSSRVYAELGGGNFMLALDPGSGGAHAAQRGAFKTCFPHHRDQLIHLSHAACQAAAVMSLANGDFDLAQFAEQAALRQVQLMMGYAFTDFPLLEKSIVVAYRALVHQVFSRHFVTDPSLIPQAKQAMGLLQARTSALIDAYADKDPDLLKGCDDPTRPPGLKPVLQALAELGGNLNGEQRATIALGAAIGTVGNVQAAVCIAVQALFAHQGALLKQAQALASKESIAWPTQRLDEWQQLLASSLRANPPIPYLPRLEVDVAGHKLGEVLLALGGGTARWSGADGLDDPLVWGLPGEAPHWCAGQALAWPLVVEVVRQVVSLPDLAQGLDPKDASVSGLKKRHGFICESYPLGYRRDRLRAQTSLNVAMRIKSPVKDNADQVRSVIRCGAPQIQRLLREARHVHFAWFELIEADTVLVLHTVYDGPFGAYLQHFALEAGDLFDALFEHLVDPPPMPVKDFPTEFAAHLLRYNRAPAMGYFFSAYPRHEVGQIVRHDGHQP